MHSLKASVADMKEALLEGDLAGVARRLHAGWTCRQKMAAGITKDVAETVHFTAEGATAWRA